MTLLLVCFVLFLVMGMPIAFVIGIAGFAYFFTVPYLNYETATQMIVSQSQSFAFLAVPFFIFAGNLMNVSGITDRLLSLARLVTRRMYGGTAQISVVMSTLMGGVSGSATADAAMETRILGPEMMRLGYKKGYICAVNCVTALITATIPPSLGLIIFGFVGEVSIGRLFAAGLIPGILMMAFLMATTSVTSRIYRYDPPRQREAVSALSPESAAKARRMLFRGALVCAAAGLVFVALPAFKLMIFPVIGVIPKVSAVFFLAGIALLLTGALFGSLPLIVREIVDNLTESIWALLFPVILIVGIRFGVFTPSESGAFAVVYAIIIGRFVYKELNWKNFKEALITTLKDNGAIMLIIAMSGPFSYAITWVKLPVALSNLIFGITDNPQFMVLIMLGFLFITGMFVDSNVNFLLLTPIFLPMVKSAGIDPVHFGVLMATVVTLGVMTPPIGSALYTVCGIIDCPPEEYAKHSLPFMAAVLLELAILVYLPGLVLWIPNMVFGK
ncbi:MAG: TRAP transporter large permease [Treponema sp.]|jgi:TRAP-type C4-dicarboxylate transport system permease large subunit|nr:TRAP transporter large permease [Treponema sp.]